MRFLRKYNESNIIKGWCNNILNEKNAIYIT